MSIAFKLCIRFYWLLIPESKRRNCVYHISCSRHVYNTIEKYGFINGLKAFAVRFKTCRPGYEIIHLREENTFVVQLIDGTFLQENEVAENVINKHMHPNEKLL